MLIRIVGLLTLVVIAILGYIYIDEWRRQNQNEEYQRYAAVIAETSLAAELYRNEPLSFLAARDSILARYGVALEEMRGLYRRFESRWPQAAELWKRASEAVDSLVKIRILEINDSLKKHVDDTT
jgi:hypothetical protein